MTAIFYYPNKLQVVVAAAAKGVPGFPNFPDIKRPYPDSTEDFDEDEDDE